MSTNNRQPITDNGLHVLVTGGAGFIGSHVSRKLIDNGYRVTVLDNFDPFYDPAVKRRNIEDLMRNGNFHLIEGDIRDTGWVGAIPDAPQAIIHLAAKAGVRPSIDKTREYLDVNINGTLSILEYARVNGIKKIIFGSSSSVYGVNPNVPWKESDTDLRPISPYAQSKIAGEQLCRVYAHLHDMGITALRFFTVYGPGQRPDLAIHGFIKKILNDEPIVMYGDGSTARDYTYVGDIVQGILAALERDATKGFEVLNLGNTQKVTLKELIATIEAVLRRKAIIKQLPEQPGDVPLTCADITAACKVLGYTPATDLRTGIAMFREWYLAKEQVGVSNE